MIIEELVTHLGIDVDSSDLKGFKTQLAGAAAVMGGLAAAGATVVSVIGEVLATAGQDAELKLFADGLRDSFEAIQELRIRRRPVRRHVRQTARHAIEPSSGDRWCALG